MTWDYFESNASMAAPIVSRTNGSRSRIFQRILYEDLFIVRITTIFYKVSKIRDSTVIDDKIEVK